MEEALKRESETVDKRAQETYSWLIVPKLPKLRKRKELEEEPACADKLVYEQERLQGSPILERAARKLKNNERLIHQMSPDSLMMELEPLSIWDKTPHLGVKKLWERLTNYCYLPRLADQSVLEATIVDGVNRMFPAFAYATGIDEEGKYTGLTIGRRFTLYFDDKALIVQPEAARKQLDAERAAMKREAISLPAVGRPAPDVSTLIPDSDTPAPPKPKTRYFGSADIDPQRAMRDLSQIADEVIVRLASLPGADFRITVEIEASRLDGFDDATVRTNNENSRTLGFRSFDFEQ